MPLYPNFFTERLSQQQRAKLMLSLFALLSIYFIGLALHLWRLPLLRISAYEALPANSALSIEITDYQALQAKSGQLQYKEALAAFPLWKSMQSELQLARQILGPQASKYLAVAQAVRADSLGWLILVEGSQYSLSSWLKEQQGNLPSDSRAGYEVYRKELSSGQTLHLCYYRGLWMLSQHQELVQAATAQIDRIGQSVQTEWRFRELAKEKKQTSDLKVYVHIAHIDLLLSLLGSEGQEQFQSLKTLGTWIGGSIDLQEKHWILNGQFFPQARSNRFWAALLEQKQAEKPLLLPQYIPDNVALLTAFSCADSRTLYKASIGPTWQAGSFEEFVLPWLGQEYAYFITEPSSREFEGDKFVLLRSRDSSLSRKTMRQAQELFGGTVEELKGYALYELKAKDFFLPLFGAELNPIQNPHYLFTGEFLLFANSRKALERWIDKMQDKKSLSASPSFEPFLHQMQNWPHAYFWCSPRSSLSMLRSYVREEWQAWIEESFEAYRSLGPIGIELTSSQGSSFRLTCSGLYTPETKKQEHSSPIDRAWQFELQSPVARSPQILANPSGGQLIAVQDQEHILYVCNSAGEELARYPLESPIRGEISLIDYHQLGEARRELCFASQEHIYILDIFTHEEPQLLRKISLVRQAASPLLSIDYGKGPRLYINLRNGESYAYNQYGELQGLWQPLTGMGVCPSPLYYSPEEEKETGKAVSEQIWMLNSKGKLQSFDRKGQRVFKGLQISGVESFHQDYVGKRFALGSKDGKIHIVNTEGKHFRIAPPEDAEAGLDVRLVLANVRGDKKPEYLRLQGQKIWIHGYDSTGNFVEFAQLELPYIPKEFFALNIEKTEAKLWATREENNRIHIYRQEKDLLADIPLQSDFRFPAAQLFDDARPVLIRVEGSRLEAIKLR